METNFLIKALPIDIFYPLMALNDEKLALHNAKWINVDSEPGYPCRVSLSDAKVGERVLAISFVHHDVSSPYRGSGPIFVRENAITAELEANEIPKMLRHRLLSMRAYNSINFMIGAQVVQGTDLQTVIENQFENNAVEYIHVHNANPGCFNCAVYRA